MTAKPEWQPSACILCECNCGIEIAVEGRRFARIRGDRAHPGSRGYTCNKALRLDHYQNGRDRITSPLRRRGDGSFEEVDWETAITEVAARLAQVRDVHGGERIFYYGGGGQGNHLGAGYGHALARSLGVVYRSNALAQEKTGEFWVDSKLHGAHTRGDFERAEVAVFVGKNPWQSQSFPRARVTLKEISADPERALIVLDPVRTETAKLADYHLRARPGSDAWCLAALAAVLVQEDLVNERFVADHTSGAEPVLAALSRVSVGDYARRCGVEEAEIRAAARRIGSAESVATFEDLGVQQAPHSVLSSYLEKLLWILTGSFAKPGAMHAHSMLANLPAGALPPASSGPPRRHTPVTGARIITGLVPCNVIAEEILTDHPCRMRALIVESSNPAHSLADSQRFREAMAALEFSVVIDVALTETARCANYVLPASSQFEKWEATFFNFEFPRNTFHLRAPVLKPLPGTLPEPEIHARLMRELDVVDEAILTPLRAAAAEGREPFGEAFFAAATDHPVVMDLMPYVLYETLGPTLPAGSAAAATLWGWAQMIAAAHPDAVRRAGHRGEGRALGEALFGAMLSNPSGITFTVDEYEDAWRYMRRPDRRMTIEIPALLMELEALADEDPIWTSSEFPFVLSAGERRSSTANAIVRDPAWRKRDGDGALRISVEDAQRLQLELADQVLVTTERGSARAAVEITDTMLPGHVALPNGLGLNYPDDEGRLHRAGVPANELTSVRWRDPFAGTPWHKHVPARVEKAT
jgi:anaerobic selenocysteine-containing dehydrogenase